MVLQLSITCSRTLRDGNKNIDNEKIIAVFDTNPG